LPKVTAPTLILVGEKGAGTPVAAAEAIRQQIKGPELVVIPGTLHLTNVEMAVRFNQNLLGFLG
jgi:pimeloyl-ACP methyl ester carboxylesterase